MYCRVIPALRLPEKFNLCDYRVPNQIAVTRGDLVHITFARRKTLGLVVDVAELPRMDPAKVKPIDGVPRGLRFPVSVFQTIEAIRTATGAPLPLILKSFLPQPPKRL